MGVRPNENSTHFLGLSRERPIFGSNPGLDVSGSRLPANCRPVCHGSRLFQGRVAGLSASIARRRWPERVGVRCHFPFLLVSPRERRAAMIVRVINQTNRFLLTCARGESHRHYAEQACEDFSSTFTELCHHKSPCLQVVLVRHEPDCWG